MAEPDEQETRAKTFLRDWQTRKEQYENHWPSKVAEESLQVENGLAAAFDASLAERKQRMAALHTAISAAKDEQEADRLCGNLLDEKGMAEKLLQALSDRIRSKYDVDNPSAASGDVTAPGAPGPDVEVISVSSDADDTEDDDDGVSDDGSPVAPSGAATGNTGTRASRRSLMSCC
jgi:hypothetical protein